MIDLELGENISIIHKNRGSRGGGVAILFDKSKCRLGEYKITGNPAEVVAAVGKFNGDTRKVLVMSVYLPQKIKAERLQATLEAIELTISRVKSENTDPYIFIGGDFNGLDFNPAIRAFPDMAEVDSPPTRGAARLLSLIHI